MMLHQPSETPCIGAPCLCHHNPDGSPIRDDGRIGVLVLTTSVAEPAHGFGRIKRLLMGPVSHAVALHAPCSVEIVRGDACAEDDEK